MLRLWCFGSFISILKMFMNQNLPAAREIYNSAFYYNCYNCCLSVMEPIVSPLVGRCDANNPRLVTRAIWGAAVVVVVVTDNSCGWMGLSFMSLCSYTPNNITTNSYNRNSCRCSHVTRHNMTQHIVTLQPQVHNKIKQQRTTLNKKRQTKSDPTQRKSIDKINK